LPKGWDTPKPAAHAFEVDVARVERTLLSAAFDVDLTFRLLRQEDSYQGMPSGMPKARNTVKERRFSAA
jgi:hypothetical protein